ncbi:peroxiredoxin family protein [Parafilimonas sp.]|uniref:peroxiredoxin family protein n=1 Tax=Parafilimonas sp. TaxID=1969739 RepID=UPI0039E5C2F5
MGSVFPDIKVLNKNYAPVLYAPATSISKYVLIDFWFSHCTPCLQEFPTYARIYERFKKNGFEIAGISVDQKQDRNIWAKVVIEKKLNWAQYLDEDGKIANRLSITQFPTNFLLDSNGIIIKKNLIPEEPEAFLSSTAL